MKLQIWHIVKQHMPEFFNYGVERGYRTKTEYLPFEAQIDESTPGLYTIPCQFCEEIVKIKVYPKLRLAEALHAGLCGCFGRCVVESNAYYHHVYRHGLFGLSYIKAANELDSWYVQSLEEAAEKYRQLQDKSNAR